LHLLDWISEQQILFVVILLIVFFESECYCWRLKCKSDVDFESDVDFFGKAMLGLSAELMFK
jgi:hypothetical protein